MNGILIGQLIFKTLILKVAQRPRMTRNAWEDRIVGARMATDERFTEQIQASEFSRQEWGLIMTAVEFEVEHPSDAERARIVADTSKLSQIMPELEKMAEQMGGMAGPGGDDAPGGPSVLDSVKSALGFGGSSGPDPEREETAAQLAQAYADELQTLLEERSRWHEVRELAAEEAET